jgi:predicted RNA-binding protein
MTDQPSKAPTRSYKTSFARDENPISEGGLWLNGRRDGIDWIDIVSKAGVVYGEVTRMGVAERRVEQGNLGSAPQSGTAHIGDYDDPTAILAGAWGKNQFVRGKVFSRNQTEKYFQEVELRLRSTMTPHLCTGYEVFWRCLKNERAYAEIARWNGKVGDFTSLKKFFGPQFGVKDGDLVEASIIGNLIRGYINGVEVISAEDHLLDSGSPGIGFNFGVGNTNVDHGFTYFEADTYD